MATLEERFNDLKKLRQECLKKNRVDIYNEAKENGLEDENQEDPDSIDETSETENTPISRDQDNTKLQVLSYTVKDDENWQKKLSEAQNTKIESINDFKNLAERTYQKQIKEHAKLSDSSLSRERNKKYMELKSQGYSDEQIRANLTNEEDIRKESERVKIFEAKVYKRRGNKQRRAMQDTGIAINEKNRAFNEKLKRELEQLEGDR